MHEDLAALDGTAQAELVRRGDVTPRELVEAAIERMEKLDPQLGAVIHPCPDRARERAAARDLADGPFRGVPFLMKDIGGEEAGEPVHAGMRFARDAGWRAPADSYFTQRIREAGLVSIGRTNTPELALLPTTEPDAYGPTRNPWNPAYSAGGSSGGAAAAVAAGIVPMAHASDGGGSIRGPASMCGLVGLKPTRGRCSFGPGLGERWSGLSCEFAVTRTVRDSAALLDCVAGPMPGDPYSAAPPLRPFRQEAGSDPGRLRVGVMRVAPRGIELHPDVLQGVDAVAHALEAQGHVVEESHPDALDDPAVAGHYVTVVACNTARALQSWGEKVGRAVGEDDVESLTWELAQRGGELPSTALLATLEYVHGYGRRLAEWWRGGFDLLLTPTQAQPPVRLGVIRSTREEPLRAFLLSAPYGVFTFPFNLSGQPALSLPAHWTAEGLPVGAQLVAPTGREDVLLRAAAQLESVLAWPSRRPPLHA